MPCFRARPPLATPFLALASLTFAMACGDSAGPTVNLTPELARRIAPRLAVMAFAVANGRQGRSFFDNAIPCVRRGVVDYVNTDNGRAVTIAGCDLGDGLVVSGSGELRWGGTVPAADREPFCNFGSPSSCATSLAWTGELRITIDGSESVVTNEFDIPEVVASAGDEGAVLHSMTVDLGSTDVGVDDAGAVLEDVFDATGIDLGSIPNQSGSLDALTDADLRRIALHGAMSLAFFLFDETLEAARGDHAHTTDCGTTDVTIDAELFPHLANTWSSCSDQGLFFDGSFTMEWGRWELEGNDLGTIRMDIAGDLTMGGAVPAVTVTSMRWTVSGGALPTDLEVTLELVGAGGTRTFTITIPVDD